ncbi:MAG: CBS domain-containing protein [Betaproteobacteria bacterium]|nr:CBS domain-containing protein [Betaproteobacteria bacterium]MDH5579180.1 CBS domain-containing protein [Betaproteobacteria bacterium]
MDRQYQGLPIRELGANAGLRRPQQAPQARVTRESPALAVMTDLARVSAATIRAQAPIEGANEFMRSRGVRLLLVVDEGDTVLGVLTAADLLGEKPTQLAVERGGRRDELTVADLMTPSEQVEVVELAAVEGARVGHVMETLRRAGRQHALVVDYEHVAPRTALERPVERAMVRGIFSLSQVARQLGVAAPQAGEVARTFAEIEAALGH